MTARVSIISHGNHPSDVVDAYIGDDRIVRLYRGTALELSEGERVFFKSITHGSGALHKHEAMAVMVEGPGMGMVRTSFNPSLSTKVERIKMLAAALINEIADTHGDGRCRTLAYDAIEAGAMWAVKSVTREEK